MPGTLRPPSAALGCSPGFAFAFCFSSHKKQRAGGRNIDAGRRGEPPHSSHFLAFNYRYSIPKLAGCPPPLLSLSLSLPAGASSCSGTDGTSSGGPGVPGPPPLHAPPGSTPRTPDFLRHRQLPLVPGDPQTPAAEAPRDAEGPIYESIRYKSRKLSAGLRKPCGATGDGGDPGQGLVVQEEPCGNGSPCPVYARVRKAPRAPQRSAPSRGPEPEEEAPPALPEKRFDDL